MTRAKRRRPLLAANIPSGQDDAEHEDRAMEEGLDRGDDVDEFITERHSQMAKAYDLHQPEDEDDDDEQEMKNVNVFDLEASDSEDSDSDLLDDDHGEDSNEDIEKDDRGGSRKNWYGGDTHEYEIMEDEEREELLLDEEEEAIRLQKRALQRALLEDYGQEEDDESGEETENDDKVPETDPFSSQLDKSSSIEELQLLADDFRKSLDELSHLKERILTNEPDRIRHQLLSLFITNVALYFSLRTDPDSVGVDLRSHPVLHRIVQIRSLLQKSKTLPVAKLTTETALHLDEQAAAEDTGKERNLNPASEERVGHAENGNVEGRDTENGNHSRDKINELVGMENGLDPLASREAKRVQKKRANKAKRNRNKTKASSAIAADEKRVTSILQASKRPLAAEEGVRREEKTKKLNKMVGAMERERKNDEKKRMVSADLDHIREEADNAKPRKEGQAHAFKKDAWHEGSIDDEEVMRKLLAKREKKESRKARKAAESKPHVYTFNDEIHADGKRKASSQIVKNRGLTRYRRREKKTPRTRNRLSYQKAIVRRKGAVREYSGTPQANYGGEASGINMSARKSSML